MAAVLNNNLQSNYLTGFQNWAQLVNPQQGSATPSRRLHCRVRRLDLCDPGGDPVMAMPPIPQVLVPDPTGVFAIGNRITNPNLGNLAPRHGTGQLDDAKPDDDRGRRGRLPHPGGFAVRRLVGKGRITVPPGRYQNSVGHG